jgi:hypothetical protein
MSILEKQVLASISIAKMKISHVFSQLDGVIESMTTLRVVPLADPPVASYSEFVATWGWLGRGSQVTLLFKFETQNTKQKVTRDTFRRVQLMSCITASWRPSISAQSCTSCIHFLYIFSLKFHSIVLHSLPLLYCIHSRAMQIQIRREARGGIFAE